MPATCPTLNHYLAADECLENLAGLGEVVYVGLKSDLSAPLTADDNTYSTPAFSGTGKGLYKFELKEEAQKIAAESQGKRKGYNITGTMVFDGVDKKTSKILRALNNLDWFAIFPDPSGDAQILYDPNKKISHRLWRSNHRHRCSSQRRPRIDRQFHPRSREVPQPLRD